MRKSNSIFGDSGTENSSPDKGRLGGVSFIPYYSKLTFYARQNRKNPTIAEQKIWQMLRKEQFAEFKFTRQKPLDIFIVDFYCPKLLLVIEIDGESHSRQEEYDNVRSNILEKKYGIEVVRYTNVDVLQNQEGVYEDLLKKVNNRQKILVV